MKKLFFGAIIALTTATPALADQIIDENGIKADADIDTYDCISPKFTSDNKAYLYGEYLSEDRSVKYIGIYDDDIQKVKDFSINAPENSRGYRVTKQRAKVESTYTGEWTEETEYGSPDWESYFVYLKYYDTSEDDSDNSLDFSQTFFNSDSKYEFIQPCYELVEDRHESDWDYDGEVDHIDIYYVPKVIGYSIINELGETLQTIIPNLPEGHRIYNDCHLLNINGKCYLVMNYEGNNSEYYLYYRITPGQSSVQQVGEPIRTSVFPTMSRRDEMVTVELDDAADAQREIVVTNAQGQTVYKQRVAPGEKRVQINSGRLSHGLNIVTVKGDNSQQSCKVLVK